MKQHLSFSASFLVLLVLIAGCGGERIPELFEASGTVLDSNGQPMAEIEVMFLPDPEKDNIAGPSSGVTGDDGRFILYYRGNSEMPGVASGPCRVMLSDLKASNEQREQGANYQRRIDPKYVKAATTPLSFDVKEEDGQTFDIRVKDRFAGSTERGR